MNQLAANLIGKLEETVKDYRVERCRTNEVDSVFEVQGQAL